MIKQSVRILLSHNKTNNKIRAVHFSDLSYHIINHIRLINLTNRKVIQ